MLSCTSAAAHLLSDCVNVYGEWKVNIRMLMHIFLYETALNATSAIFEIMYHKEMVASGSTILFL